MISKMKKQSYIGIGIVATGACLLAAIALIFSGCAAMPTESENTNVIVLSNSTDETVSEVETTQSDRDWQDFPILPDDNPFLTDNWYLYRIDSPDGSILLDALASKTDSIKLRRLYGNVSFQFRDNGTVFVNISSSKQSPSDPEPSIYTANWYQSDHLNASYIDDQGQEHACEIDGNILRISQIDTDGSTYWWVFTSETNPFTFFWQS